MTDIGIEARYALRRSAPQFRSVPISSALPDGTQPGITALAGTSQNTRRLAKGGLNVGKSKWQAWLRK